MFTFCVAVISNPHNTLNQLNKKNRGIIKLLQMPNFCLEGTLACRLYGYVPQIYSVCALSPTKDLYNFCMEKNTWMHECPNVDGYAHHHFPFSNIQVHVQLFSFNALPIINEH